jgi:hypothetical protein
MDEYSNHYTMHETKPAVKFISANLHGRMNDYMNHMVSGTQDRPSTSPKKPLSTQKE